MKVKGFCPLQKVADTLQGAIYRCRVMDGDRRREVGGETVMIKVTAKQLHSEGMTLSVDGQRGEVQEDILKERDLLHRISGHRQGLDRGH